MKQYYIVSLKHTSKGDTALTFWCANGAGYTWDMYRAGVYDEEEIKKCVSEDNVAVLKEIVDPFWMRAVDYGDKYIAVANTPTVLNKFRLNSKFMKAKKYASCRMTFVNTPINAEP